MDTAFSLSPVIQAGYFDHISNSRWLKGGKFSYSYLGLGLAKSDMTIPQAGGFTQNANYIPFTGNYLVQSFRQTVIQQMSVIPFAGREFEKSYVYFGIGPMTAQTKSSIESITGYENVAPLPTTPTGLGLGDTYNTTQWLFGGIAMAGATYYIDSEWFIDMSYTYSITGRTSNTWGGPWNDTDISRGNAPRIGTNSGTVTGSVNTQFLAITINKAF